MKPIKKIKFKWLILAAIATLFCALISPVWSLEGKQVSPSNLIQQGKVLYNEGRYTEAVQVLQQELKSDRNNNQLTRAMVLSNLALTYQQLGNWTGVSQTILESEHLLNKLEESPEKLQILAQIQDIQGRLNLVRGNTEEALASWEKATATYDRAGNATGVLRSRINQSQALQALGLYRRALKTLDNLKETLQQQPDSLTKAVGLRSLGNALHLVGDLEQSRLMLKQSLAIAQRLQSPSEISAALFSLGNTERLASASFMSVGDANNATEKAEVAIAFYQQAIAASTSPTEKLQAQLNQLNMLINSEQRSPAEALIPQIQSQLARLSPSRTAIYARINLAQSLTRLKETQKKKEIPSNWSEIEQILSKAVKEAQEIGDRQAQSYALGSLGGLYEKTAQISKAEAQTQQALILAQAVDARDISYQWQWQLGRLLKATGKKEDAIAAYRQTVQTLQSLRSDLIAINPDIQFTFRESVEPIYRQYVDLLLSTQASEKNLTEAREAIDSLQLAELENFFRATCLEAQPVIIDNVTDKDDPNAAILYPIVLGDRFEIILKLPQQPLRHYTTPFDDPQKVERILERLAQNLRQWNHPETITNAQTVYNWLLRDAEADIAKSNVKTLVFVLDSPLRNLPMAVLHDGKQFLIEKYSIALTPGLRLLQPKPLVRQELKAITAGLTEARSGFSPLKYVGEELAKIQSLVPSVELLNNQFTSQAFQDKLQTLPFPIVHLATHGNFSSQAENTFILAWDDRINVNQLNELLRSSEQTRNNAIELLVLSACETLTGDKRAALGLAGVAVRAGARSTLATLWQVNDEASALLIGQFYEALKNPQIAKAEALRHAQLSLLANPDLKSPYYWAPYVLVGNWL
ncbi:MAG: CHAT domain-containing protein [Hydrococcus sp. Prado102]|jgi:CHAT domain-containing protein|nr:CHAT domain-containing protein [Hydrococcus sp. Prado102]